MEFGYLSLFTEFPEFEPFIKQKIFIIVNHLRKACEDVNPIFLEDDNQLGLKLENPTYTAVIHKDVVRFFYKMQRGNVLFTNCILIGAMCYALRRNLHSIEIYFLDLQYSLALQNIYTYGVNPAYLYGRPRNKLVNIMKMRRSCFKPSLEAK